MWSINFFSKLISFQVFKFSLFTSKRDVEVHKVVNKPMFVKNKIVMMQNLKKKKKLLLKQDLDYI